IDELAKAIGKKVEANGLGNEADRNTSLLAGAHEISILITQKLTALKDSGGLKAEIAEAKKCSEAFTKKLKDNNAQLGIQNVQDVEAKKAILKTNGDISKGAKELKELFESVESLAKAAQAALANSVQ
ncbi:Vsp/OspC family lipoprotein, partial [Borreliella valaisiana]